MQHHCPQSFHLENDGPRLLRGLRGDIHLQAGGTAGASLFERDARVVVKHLNLEAPSSCLEEIRILGSVLPLHKGIVYLYDYESPDRAIKRPGRLSLEYCDGGDLGTAIDIRVPDQLPEAFVWHVFLRLAEALAHMHAGWESQHQRAAKEWNPVIHRDLKPYNIFLKTVVDQYPDVIIGDFGHAGVPLEENFNPYKKGTPEYQAPEIPFADEKADVWGLGATIYGMIFNGGYPIRATDFGRAEREECRIPESRILRPPLPDGHRVYSRRLYHWLARCLEYDPYDRPTAVELARELAPEARQYRDTHFERVLL